MAPIPTPPPRFSLTPDEDAPPAQETPRAEPPPLASPVLDAPPVIVSGRAVADSLAASGYHPVVIFGNANSGKTSLLLSLLRLVKTSSYLKVSVALGDPLLDLATPQGQVAYTGAQELFGIQTQRFIAGEAPKATSVQEPFFVPLVLRTRRGEDVRLALLESNGEWYSPQWSSASVFPPLRQQIEDFIVHFSGGVSFVHVLPRTQSVVGSAAGNFAEDMQKLRDADLAVAGALDAYNRKRLDKSADSHILLVTKWDAHAGSRPGLDLAAVLDDPGGEFESFVTEHAPQSVAALRGMSSQVAHHKFAAYCSGHIQGQTVVALEQRPHLGRTIDEYALSLWDWLYAQHPAAPPPNPFRRPPLGVGERLRKFTQRLLGLDEA